MVQRILLIEDDPDITELVRIHLTDAGYELEAAIDGETGLQRAMEGNCDLVILDLMLPRLSGLDVCRHLHEKRRDLPVMMLTSRSEEVDRVLGLELGADDYLTKPFSVRELVARVRAILRRLERTGAPAGEGGGSPGEAEGPLVCGDLCIDEARRRVTAAGRDVELTAKEFELLLLFARHPGRVYSRPQLLEQVWGYQFQGYEHTVNSHIHRLRSKLEEDPANPLYITTVWGVGYRFADREGAENP